MSNPPTIQWPQLSHLHALVFDFDGVFTDNKVYIDQSGIESVVCDRADGLGFDLLRAHCSRINHCPDMFILSKEPNPVVLARSAKLKLECRHGIDNKLKWMNNYLHRKFSDNRSSTDPWQGVAYLGNDLNDLPVMACAGLSVAPSDAHIRVRKIATSVLPLKGGHGFIRAFIEKITGLNEASDEEIHELIHHC